MTTRIDDNNNVFNQIFNKNIGFQEEHARIAELNKLRKLQEATEETSISVFDMSIKDIIINVNSTWFNILNDLLDQQFTVDVILKNNRLFYVGLTIVVVCIILYVYQSSIA